MKDQESLRALDQIDAPDRWADIVGRADAGEATGPTMAHPGRDRWLAVAAVIVGVAALAGAVVVATRSDDSEHVTAGPDAVAGSSTGPGGSGSPSSLWGKRWRVVSATASNGGAIAEAPDQVAVLDAGAVGRLAIEACGDSWGAFRIDGSVLVSEGSLQTRMVSCRPPNVGVFLEQLVLDQPTVSVDDQRLVLRSDIGEIEAVPDAPDDPSGLFGHSWDVTDIVDNGEPLTFSHHDWTPDHPVVEASVEPTSVEVPGCSGAGGQVELDGGRLVPVEPWPESEPLCASSSVMRQDEWFQDFLLDGPVVVVHGGTATLRTTDAEVRMVRVQE